MGTQGHVVQQHIASLNVTGVSPKRELTTPLSEGTVQGRPNDLIGWGACSFIEGEDARHVGASFGTLQRFLLTGKQPLLQRVGSSVKAYTECGRSCWGHTQF